MNELKQLLSVVREAGSAILALKKHELNIATKDNHDIVTQADLLANAIIKSHLLAAYPKDGWLSEECVDNIERLHSSRVWIVDPIDGTREFAKGISEYAISVALVAEGQLSLAVVFNPAKNELFYAQVNKGAWLNGERVFCRKQCSSPLSLLASRSEYNRGEWASFQTQTVKPVGSIAYKMALIAAGRADATFSLSPKNEWDIAAGTLLVKEAGGIVLDKTKQALSFNKNHVEVNGVIAMSKAAQQQVFALIDQELT